jgi:2-amino-4-hydroxy-6-hydroxymethyldihydropteridine diphosphokinase
MRWAVGVGGNLGDVPASAAHAAVLLTDAGVHLLRSAPWIVTAPVGGPPQPPFHNSAWLVETALGPHQLLAALQRAETACGRVRSVRWGPRTLDLDLLLAEDGTIVRSEVLELPHPRLHERAFVLVPLAAIIPDWLHPVLRRRIAELASSAARPAP